ncbi:MarR family winged helix-turn-helix transcriptional regulator [Nonomuraea sp. NPDC004186]
MQKHPQAKIHRMFELVEPIATVTFSEVANEAFLAVGMRNYWDGYFAGRAAPLGLAPAEVVHAVFYNFADGEVARHIPWVWGKISPQEAIAVRERGSAAALRQGIGELADSLALVRIADLATRAALSAPAEGRVLYAGLRALDVPEEPVARLWHAATLLREHRGDGHNAALLAHGIGGTESHVLMALSLGMRAEEFGRIHHLPKARLAAVVDGLRGRGLVDAAGRFTHAGREIRQRIEELTDELAAPAYDVLSADELDELAAGLEPIAAAVQAVDD